MYGCRQWEDAVGDNGVLIVYVLSTDLYLLSICMYLVQTCIYEVFFLLNL